MMSNAPWRPCRCTSAANVSESHVPASKQLAAEIDDERVGIREAGDGLAQPHDFDDRRLQPNLQRSSIVRAPLVGQVHLTGRDQAEKLEQPRLQGALGPKVGVYAAERRRRRWAVERDGDRAARGLAAGPRQRVVDPRARLVVHVGAREQRQTRTGFGIDRETGCPGLEGLRGWCRALSKRSAEASAQNHDDRNDSHPDSRAEGRDSRGVLAACPPTCAQLAPSVWDCALNQHCGGVARRYARRVQRRAGLDPVRGWRCSRCQ